MATLTLLCGLPASGKSTYAQRLARAGAGVLTSDKIRTHNLEAPRVFAAIYGQARRELRAGRDVVIDACSLRPSARRQARWLAAETGADIVLVVLCTPPDVCRTRNARRVQPASFDWTTAARVLRDVRRDVVREKYAQIVYV